jgi:hypothetical protein
VPGASAHEGELRLDLPNGGQVRLYGSDNPDALRGLYLDGLVIDEAADIGPRLFNEILRPALSDRRGWCVWIGTPRGQNDFHDLWQTARAEPERFFTLMLRASQSGLIEADELTDARRTMTPEQYAQEYACSFQAAIIGAYYGREMQAAEDEGRIVPRLYDPGLAVNTAWDLGMSDHTPIWFFQQSGFEIRLIDYYAAHGFGLDHYAKVIQDKGSALGRHHFWPHDGAVRELGTGRSRLETMRGLGLDVTIVRKLSDEDGINAVRRILPRCWFDRDRCAEGIRALRQFSARMGRHAQSVPRALPSRLGLASGQGHAIPRNRLRGPAPAERGRAQAPDGLGGVRRMSSPATRTRGRGSRSTAGAAETRAGASPPG